MKAKARSLSAPQERKSKVALNCIIRAVLYKGRVFTCRILLSQRKDKRVVNWGELAKQNSITNRKTSIRVSSLS